MPFTPNYTPLSGDNTALLTAALAIGPVYLPAGTIEVSGNIPIQSGAILRGQGIGITIIKRPNNSPIASTFTNTAPISNVQFSDFTFDANSANQTGQSYPFGFSSISQLDVERVQITNPYGCAFWLNGPDPGVPPYGAQINSNITIRDCLIDGNAQVVRGSDLIVIGRSDRVLFEGNTVQTSGANMLAVQFTTHATIKGNTFSNGYRSIYIETCQNCTIEYNDISGFGQPASQMGDVQMIGIWLVDADQSYVGGGYSSPQNINIVHNKIHDMSRTPGTTGVVGILISGKQNLPAASISVIGNTMNQFNGNGGLSIGISVTGDANQLVIWGNSTTGIQMGYFPVGGSYNGYNRMQNISFLYNTASGATWPMYSVNASGTANNFTCIGNNFPGAYDVGITSSPGFVSAHNG